MDSALESLIWTRARENCEYCQTPFKLSPAPFQIDHVVAKKHGGQTLENNLALSCYDCNSYKGANIAGIDPVSGRVTRLYNPRRDRWAVHFEWNGATLDGISAIGRATIRVLWINHPASVVLRGLWIEGGLFPVQGLL